MNENWLLAKGPFPRRLFLHSELARQCAVELEHNVDVLTI